MTLRRRPREAEGWTFKVVDVADVFEAFGHGVFSAEAIRAYLRYAYLEMGTEAVLLVGGDTYDYHDYLGLGSMSFVPSLYAQTDEIVHFAPVDSAYVDVDSDGVPDMAIGRFPVRTAEELASVVAKTLEYGAMALERTAVMAVDAADGESGYSFRAASEEMAAMLPPEWTITWASLDELGVEAAHAELISRMNGGVSLVSYFGHSGPTVWSFQRQTKCPFLNSGTRHQALSSLLCLSPNRTPHRHRRHHRQSQCR